MTPYNYGPPFYPLWAFFFREQEVARELISQLQAPDALVAMYMLAVMSASCQGLIDVRYPTGKIGPVSVNWLGIAAPGEGKTPIEI